MTPVLAATDVAIERRLQPTSLRAGHGSLIALIGANGSGKTSLLRALAGIEPTRGEVRVDGEILADIAPARRRRILSFLPASRDLVWPITARDVIALGLPSDDPRRVGELLEQLELRPLAERPANQLSTGERARVLLARALAPSPRLLLLDEPLSNLDPYWILMTLDLLRGLVGSGCTAIVSLHDIDRAEAFDRALLMSGGKVVADEPPVELLDSEILSDCFRIEKQAGSWMVRPSEGRRSSP